MWSNALSLFHEFLANQKDNLLLWIAIFLGLGSGVYFALDNQPHAMTTTSLISMSLFCSTMMYRLTHISSRDNKPYVQLMMSGLLLSAIISVLCIGFAAGHIKTDLVTTAMIQRETRPVMVTATIDHREDKSGKGGSLLFLSDISIEGWNEQQTPNKVRLTMRQTTDIKSGDRISVLAKLTPLSPPVAPGSYDFARHYYFEGIGALGYTLSQPTILHNAPQTMLNLDAIRSKISDTIKTIVSEREAGIVSALMTGERAAIAEEDWTALRHSGLAHIISISGMHVVMIAAPIFFIVRLFLAMIPYIALRYPIKKIAALTALIVCCLYVGLVVPSVPTTRALLMTGIGLIAIMLDRSPFSLRLVGFSAILVLLISPESIWSASFQMSFAAVTALVAVAEWSRPKVIEIYSDAGFFTKSGLWISGTLLTSLVASLATAPFSLYHFGQMANYSVLANALSVPISGILIMPMVILSFALMPFGLAEWPLTIMSWGVKWLLNIARWTSDLPGSVTTISALTIWFIISTSCLGLTLILAKSKIRIILTSFLASVSLILLLWPSTPDIYVSNDGKLMSIKFDKTILTSSLRTEKFTQENWAKRWDLPLTSLTQFPKQGEISFVNGPDILHLNCDRAACRLNWRGHTISFGTKFYELKQDCDWATLIISPLRLPRNFCDDKTVKVIGYYELQKSGAIGLHIDEKIKIDTVVSTRGIRPWTQ